MNAQAYNTLYDTVAEKFRQLVLKSTKTLFMNEREVAFLTYVGKHFYTGVRNKKSTLPTAARLKTAHKLM